MITASNPTELYLDLMKRALLNTIYGDTEQVREEPAGFLKRRAARLLESSGARIIRERPVPPEAVEEGKNWPRTAFTMIGRKRLENLQFCVETALRDGVVGDVLEAGVWRGGASIFMRAILKAHGVADRTVWLADSFAGLPTPNAEKYPADAGDAHHKETALAVSLEQVQEHFRRFGLLDDQVRFLKGWFSETLHKAPIERLAVLRLDGDMYESTMDGLRALYPKVSAGGFIIIDDYGYLESCRRAVADYRKEFGIGDEIKTIDWTGAYWRKNVA